MSAVLFFMIGFAVGSIYGSIATQRLRNRRGGESR